MAILFPGGLDSFTNPTPANNLSTPAVLHSDQHSNINDAVEALEVKIGVDGSLVTGSFDFRINYLESVVHAPVTLGTANGLALIGQQLSLGIASGTSAGALSASDWTLFSGKQSALSFPLDATLGGTGINNAGTLTNASNTTISGGGTLGLGGFTLTVPATGTAALLATANVFTAAQMVDGSADAVQLRVQANGTQTANLQTWELNGGTVAASIEPLGYINTNRDGYGLFLGSYAAGKATTSGIWSGNVTPSSTNYNLRFLSGQLILNHGTQIEFRLSHTVKATLTTATINFNVSPAYNITSALTNQKATMATFLHVTSGTPAAGFGGLQAFQLETATDGTAQDAARISWEWIDATNASRKAKMSLSAYDTAARLGLEIEASGTEAKLGFYGVTPIARAVLATGAGAIVDDVITALQNLGLVKQS